MFKWANTKISSPNHRITCHFKLQNGIPFYSVTKGGEVIIKDSRLGFDICGVKHFSRHQAVKRFSTSSHDETIELPWGEERFIPNHYRELKVILSQFILTFRVFDDAVAFRYELLGLSDKSRVSISDELTEFNLDQNSLTWSIPAFKSDRYEYNYEKSYAYAIDHPVHTPFTVKTPSNTYLSIHEAALYDYGSMTLSPSPRGILKAHITPLSDHTKAHVNLPFKTPWRLIMIADSATNLTKNRTMYALNDPPQQDFSWVKTLKFLGIWWAMYVGEYTWAPGENHGATTAHAKEYIDAAANLGIKGLLIEGWNNGWEGDWLQNGSNSNFTTPMPDFDLDFIARYASSKGIELVGHHETVGFIDNYESQLEAAYNYYAARGIHYLKTGYAGPEMLIHGRKEYHHSQLGVNHYQKAVALAAKKQLMLDVHEPIKGTGIERTFPNLLTREGARGQEYEGGALRPSHACILPYTRLLAGGMDYTPGIFDLKNPKRPIHTTIARQLAYFITIYSGMTMAADRPFIYKNHYQDLFAFVKLTPTNFETTLPLSGEIGEFYAVARKSRENQDWFVAGVTNEASRNLMLDFDFLDDGVTYNATIYQDAADAHYLNNPLHYAITHQKLQKDDQLQIYMAPGGGFAIHLSPQ